MSDLKNFTFKKLFTKEFSYLFLLLYWPIHGLVFWLVERVFVASSYTTVYCFLDAKIPFCEFFVIPYFLWFPYLVIGFLYVLIFDTAQFKKAMYFTILTFGLTMTFYFVFPNMQQLRPTEFVRDNIFVDMVKGLYKTDTPTNVCPSMHVFGSIAISFATWNAKNLKTIGWRILFSVMTVLISISTLFLKQHSVVDVVSAIVLSFLFYPLTFILPDKIKAKREKGKR